MNPFPNIPWIVDPPPIEDEVVKGPWGYHVLQMANKYYTPPRLAYRRTQHGEDQRIKYMLYFLDVRGLRVLEIGPYEGHHSVLLEKMGVGELVCVESRLDNVAKCNRVKEKYHLDHTTIVQQDIENIYNGVEPAKFATSFDLVFCCGVLYHLPNPVKALQWFRSLAPTLFLGTHYVEPQSPGSYSAGAFQHASLAHESRIYKGLDFQEGGANDPLSGMSRTSFWPYETELLTMCQHAGYKRTSVLGKDIQNNFPHITLLASS